MQKVRPYIILRLSDQKRELHCISHHMNPPLNEAMISVDLANCCLLNYSWLRIIDHCHRAAQ